MPHSCTIGIFKCVLLLNTSTSVSTQQIIFALAFCYCVWHAMHRNHSRLLSCDVWTMVGVWHSTRSMVFVLCAQRRLPLNKTTLLHHQTLSCIGSVCMCVRPLQFCSMLLPCHTARHISPGAVCCVCGISCRIYLFKYKFIYICWAKVNLIFIYQM